MYSFNIIRSNIVSVVPACAKYASRGGPAEEMKIILTWWWHKRMARTIKLRLSLYKNG